MKKVQLKFDKEATLEFLKLHVEKIGFGVVVAGVLLICYLSIHGRKPFGKSPQQLHTKAQDIRSFLNGQSTEPENQLIDFLSIVDRIGRNPIKAGYYSHPTAWSPVEEEKHRLRGQPALYRIENLRGVSGYGAFAKKSRLAGNRRVFEGLRWIVITGPVPWEQQAAAHAKAFQSADGYDAERDAVEYDFCKVERAEVTDPGDTQNLTWQPINVEPTRDALCRHFGISTRSLTSLPDVVDERYLDKARKLTFPLSPLVKQYGVNSAVSTDDQTYAWRGTDVSHPWLMGLPRDEVKLDPAAHQGKKVTWGGEFYEVQGTQVIYIANAAAAAAGAPPEFFAVEYPDENAAGDVEAGPAGFTQVSGMVAGSATFDLEVEDSAGEFAMQSIEMPLLQYLQRQGESDESQYKLFRFFDFSVKSGKQYRYRVTLQLKNPNYQLDPVTLQDPVSAKNEILLAAVSDPTDVIAVPRDTRLLAVSASKLRSTADPTGRLFAVQFLRSKGIEAYTDEPFSVERGRVANTKQPFTPSIDLTGRATPARRTGPRKETEQTPIEVQYKTETIVLDIRGGEMLPGRDRLVAPGRFLLLDPVEGLVVRDEVEDQAAIRRVKGIVDETGGLPGDGTGEDWPPEEGSPEGEDPFGLFEGE